MKQDRSHRPTPVRPEPVPARVACEICMREIPASVAHSHEGTDYVLYFCGNDCFDVWRHADETTDAEQETTQSRRPRPK